MAQVIITRKKQGMSVVARNAVKAGQVFQYAKNGAPTGKTLIDLGNNGKSFSINTANGQLASSAKKTGSVIVVGKATVVPTYFGQADERRKTTTRGQVKSGEIFRVAGRTEGTKSYLHLGDTNGGTKLISVNMADPFNEDYAATENKGSTVEVVGVAKFEVEVVG